VALDPASAYSRLIAAVADLDGVKLHADEAATIRAAADSRFFADDDVDVRMADVDVVLLRIELGDRLTGETIERLRHRLQDITPFRSAPLAA
jgi:hypothetical protein